MGKFNFRLERLLEVRIYNEKTEENKVAQITSKLNKVKKNLGEIALELEAVTPPITTDNQLVYLQTREIFVNRLKQQEKVFLAEKEDITEELSLAKDSYQKAKQKRMVIDKLRERNLNVFRSLHLQIKYLNLFLLYQTQN